MAVGIALILVVRYPASMSLEDRAKLLLRQEIEKADQAVFVLNGLMPFLRLLMKEPEPSVRADAHEQMKFALTCLAELLQAQEHARRLLEES